jgi:hypothetical protein
MVHTGMIGKRHRVTRTVNESNLERSLCCVKWLQSHFQTHNLKACAALLLSGAHDYAVVPVAAKQTGANGNVSRVPTSGVMDIASFRVNFRARFLIHRDESTT